MKAVLHKTEHGEQCAVVNWCEVHENKWPCLKYIYAIPNGGHRHKAVAGKLKAEGVKAGVPDLCLPYPTCKRIIDRIPYGGELPGYHGLYIEMKVKGGSVKKHQQEWIDYLWQAGYSVEVAWSADEAIQIIKNYLTRGSRG